MEGLIAQWLSCSLTLLAIAVGVWSQVVITRQPGRRRQIRPQQRPVLTLVSLRQKPGPRQKRIQRWIRLEQGLIGMGAVMALYAIATLSLLLASVGQMKGVWPLIIILVLLAGAGTLLSYDAFTGKRRLQSGQSSRVAKQAEVLVDSDLGDLMNCCLAVILNMGANLALFDTQKGSIEAELGRGGLTIQIEPLDGGYRRRTVLVQSDSNSPTARFDLGTNSNNISRFIRELFELR